MTFLRAAAEPRILGVRPMSGEGMGDDLERLADEEHGDDDDDDRVADVVQESQPGAGGNDRDEEQRYSRAERDPVSMNAETVSLFEDGALTFGEQVPGGRRATRPRRR